MKIGRWRTENFFKRFYYRRIRPLLNRRNVRITRVREKNDIIQIMVTNCCNLKCFSCSTLCNIPLGSNVFRDKKTFIDPSDYKSFLNNLEGWNPDYWVRLSGGEPTLIGPKIITELCEISKKYDRKVDILTNGFRLMEIDPFFFDYIILDDHGKNSDLIRRCIDYLENKGYDNYSILAMKMHRNLESQRKGNISPGLRCNEWMNSITLWRGIIYPCCVMANLEGFDNNPLIGSALLDAGFNVDNPELVNILINWRETIPPIVVKTCSLSCWRGSDEVKWYNIT